METILEDMEGHIDNLSPTERALLKDCADQLATAKTSLAAFENFLVATMSKTPGSKEPHEIAPQDTHGR